MAFCSTAVIANVNTCKNKAAGIKSIKMTSLGTTVVTTILDTIPESSHLESVFAYNNQNGTGIWTTNVFIKLGEISAQNRTSIESMSFNHLTIECEMVSGAKITVGSADIPAYMSAGNLATGTNMEDAQGLDATFTHKGIASPTVTDPS